MSEATVFESATDYLEGIDLPPTPFDAALQELTQRVDITVPQTFQTPLGTMATSSLIVKEPLRLPILSLPLTLVVGANDEDHPVAFSALLEDEWYVEVAQAALALELTLPFLRPVDNPEAPVLIQLESGLHISATAIELLDPEVSLSLPRCEIGHTGMIVSLDELTPVLAEGNVPDIAWYYGEDESFRGLYAANATLEFMPGLLFAGQPGLLIEGNEVLIGPQGLSCEILMQFTPADPAGDPLTESEIVGGLADGGFPFVLNWLQTSIRKNQPRSFAAEGFLRLPFFDLLFQLTIGMQQDETDNWAYHAALQSLAPGAISLPAGTLSYAEAQLDGSLAGNEADLSGLIAGLQIDLDPFQIDAGTIQFALARNSEQVKLQLQLSQVGLGPIGTVENALLLVTEDRTSGALKIQFETVLVWADLHGRLEFAELPDNFPLPPDDARVDVAIHYDNGDWRFRFAAVLTELDALWAFLPDHIEPQVPEAALTLETAYIAADDRFSGSGSITMKLGLPALPPLPGLSLIHIATGDENGFIDLTVKGGFTDDNGAIAPYMNATIDNALTIDVDFPGLSQPTPPIHTRLDQIDFDFSTAADGSLAGGLVLKGDFALRPLMPSQMGLPVPPAIAVQMEQLLGSVGLLPLAGKTEQAIRFRGDRAAFSLKGTFSEAGLEVDLFDMFAGLAGGLTGPTGLDNPANAIDLDIDVRFDLKQIDLQLGRLEPDEPEFSLSITFGLTFGGASTDLTLALSDEQFTFGFSELPIPLALPKIPVHLDDLLALEGADGRWDYAGIWLAQREPELTVAIRSKNDELNNLRNQIQTLENSLIDVVEPEALGAGRAELRQLKDRALPALQKEIFQLTGNKFLIEAIFAVHNILATDANQAAYQTLVKAYQGIMDETIGRIYLDTALNFVIYDARFVLPFNDPSDIRVEGGARLSGFAADDPLRMLGDLAFKLGLSADAIYFSVEGGSEIPLPAVGRYAGGAINLQRLNLGYGYNKNSFMIDFAGELRLPPNLVDDLDTSDLIGAGLRLPIQNALAFKLDLIPVSLGEVNFVVPLLEFDIDLRQPATPGLLDANQCTPAWDGFQLIVPELLRMAIKRYRFNPFFGPLPAPNVTYSYDIQIGNENRGFTLICDNYLQISGILGYYPIPLFADAITPFFDNLCVNLAFAGFGIKFNLQRPFPSMSPLAIFELLGLLSDPMMPIDPDGQLANMARATIQNAVVSLPPAVVRLFPELGPYLDRELNYTINLSTVITLSQQLVTLIRQATDATVTAAGDMAALVAALQANPPEINLTALLRELPPELRRYQLNGAFVGFHASAYVFLLTPAEARSEYERLHDPAVTGGESLLYEADFRHEDLSAWQAVDHGMQNQVGHWVNQGDFVQQTSNTGHNDRPHYGPLLIYWGQRFADVSFTVSLASRDDDGIGVVFRYQDPQNYYRFRITRQQERWRLTRIRDGHAEDLFSQPGRYQPGRRYQLTVRCNNQLLSGPIPQQVVAIEILVNGRRWCQIVDSRPHPSSGYVGFSCWWNKDARFYSLRVYGKPADQLNVGQPTDVTAVANFQPNLGAQPIFQPNAPANNLFADVPLMSHFDDEDFATLADLADDDRLAVLTVAEVQLLPGQRYAFLGYLDEEGHFSLLSRADLESLSLTVAGLTASLPLQVMGRLLLRGRAAGADSWAQVDAQAWGNWLILPPDMARLELASAEAPATFTLFSDGRFALQGNGRLLFFGEQLVVSGGIRVDHTHCFVKGELAYEYRPVPDEPPLIDLLLASRGRIGPERTFNLRGSGDLALLGQPLSEVSGELTERALTLAGRLQVGGKNQWFLAGLGFSEVDLALQGRLQFATASAGPRLEMAGRGQITVLGATINGEGQLGIRPGQVSLGVAGALQWQGRDWLAGQVALNNDQLAISGRTTFALDLTPTDLFGDINLASLYFTIDLSGSFEFSAAAGLKKVVINVDWTLAARFPGREKQILPLASQQKRFSKYNLGDGGTLRELLYISSVNFLPFGDFTIPVPVIDMEEGVEVYLTYDGIIPQLSLEAPPPPPDDPEPLFRLPGLVPEDMPLEAILNNFNLRVRLAWENGQLGIRLVRGSDDEFIPFHAMFD